jgi:outer membrane protein insertion porin family
MAESGDDLDRDNSGPSGFIEFFKILRPTGEPILQTRGALVIILTVLALAALGVATAANEPPAERGQNQASLAAKDTSKFEGRRVQEIRLPNVALASDAAHLRELIAQKPGAPLDRQLIRQSMRELFATGRFADIRVEAEPAADGQVLLTIFTTPNYFVSEVRAEGAPSRPTAGQIVNASKLALGEEFTEDRLERALANIQQLLEENGYYHATVKEEERRDQKFQLIAVTFRIHPGTRAQVGVITVHCDPECDREEIEKVSKLWPGRPVSLERASSALERLRKHYRKQHRLLAQVRVAEKSYREEGNAVDYTLEVTPGPKVLIEAEGFKLSNSVLRQSVPIFEENAADRDLLDQGRRNLLNYLQTRGYFDARVGAPKQTGPSGGELRIVYPIEPGARHKLVHVEITGNHYFRTEELRQRMQVQPAGRWFNYGRFSQSLLASDVSGFENMYRANGFEDIAINPEVIDDYRGRENQVAIRISIAEGAQTLVGAFHLVGNKTFSAADLSRVINTAKGQAFSEYNIAEDRDNILNYYFNHGFPRAVFEAAAHPIAGQAHRMDVIFTITEGERVFVDQVHVSGLHFTRPYVVERELQTKPGDPLSQIDMLQSQQRLYDLGIFSQVDTAVQNPNGNEPRKNVLFDVQEAKRYTFSYGFGFEFQTGLPTAIGTNQALGETGVSPRASLNITRLNFRGRDHTITFKADVGSLEQRGLVNYIAPRWFGSPNWKLSFIAFYDNTLDVTTFTSQRLEGSVQAEQAVNKKSTMDYSFTFRRVKASDIQISPSQIPVLSLPVRVGGPGLSYIRNTRDNDLETSKGMYIAGNATVASSVFGSEADFSRILIQDSTYHAFGKNRPRERKFVFARSTTVGVETAFGNTSILPPGQPCPVGQVTCASLIVIPLAERFLSGGGNSDRGFGLNQAGPRDPVTGFPLGGSALFLNNLELRLPPVRLPYAQENMSFALFEDAGNVFTDGRLMLDNLLRWRQKDPGLCRQEATAGECNFSYLSHAVGVGVRYKTPVGPVRFDFGYNLNPPAFASCQAVPSYSGQAASVYCDRNSKNSKGIPTLPYFVPQQAAHFNVYFSVGQSF